MSVDSIKLQYVFCGLIIIVILEINVLTLLIKENRRRGKVEGTRRKGGGGMGARMDQHLGSNG